jgi:4-diphosphocytidyl-2-C-methyl-D-erythritol kinase
LTKVPITLKITTYFGEKLEQESNDLESTITKKNLKMKKLLSWMSNFGFAKISGTGSSVFIKLADVKKIPFINEKKPINIKSFVVKGLSKHPFYDV